nr:reverse transcriptase domain-containing protein [Tanacetum cinerariifolium]
PLDNSELTIRRRSHVDPTLLNDFIMAVEGNGDQPVPDLRTMEELCQPSLNGRVRPIAPIAIQATNFGLKNDMIQQVNQQVKAVTPNCETCGGPQSFNDCSATVGNTQNVYAAGAYQGFNQNQNRNNQNHNFQNQNRNQGNHNPQGNNQGRNQFFQGASHGQNLPPAYQASVYQAPVHQPQIPQPQVVTTNEFTNFMKANDVILKNMQTNITSLTNLNLKLKNMFGQFMKMNTASSLGSGTLPGNTITNPKEELKGITTRSGTSYQGPMIPTTSSSLPLVVKRETEATKHTVHPINNGSTKDVQPPVVQTESPILNSEPVVAPIIEPVAAPVSALKPNQRPSILYPSKLHDQKLRDKANDQREKFFQIFKDLNLNISFADALILMPKFGLTIKTLLTKKDKLSELARTLLNEHCSAILLNKLPEKLGTLATKRIDVIDMACEEYSQKVLSFSDVIVSDDKLPVIIAKDLSIEEKIALITVLKSHKRGIAWKLSDIKGIDPEFCTHKILMEDDFEPAVQHQRRVNLKIHDVIKNEGGFIVVENEENELIPTRLVTGWRMCIDYHSKARLLRWVLHLQEFIFKVIDTKGAENLAADHLSRLENPHQNVLNPKEITESFPLETLNMVSSRGNSSTSWFANFANYHAGNFIKSSEGVYMARKPLTFSRLATMNLPGDIMAQTTLPRRCLTPDSTGPLFTGIDFMGPFPSSKGNKYILIAVDYLSKWVEAKALPTNDARVVCKFFKNLFAIFETPVPFSVIEKRTSAMTSLQRSCLSSVSLTV